MPPKTYLRTPPLASPHAHPLVRQLFRIARDQRMGDAQLARMSGVERSTIRSWRTRRVPTLVNFIAVANCLGYRVVLREEVNYADEQRDKGVDADPEMSPVA